MPRSAPIARHVGRSAAPALTAARQRLPDEHAADDEHGEREQQEPVLLDVRRMFLIFGSPTSCAKLSTLTGWPTMRSTSVLELREVASAVAQRR